MQNALWSAGRDSGFIDKETKLDVKQSELITKLACVAVKPGECAAGKPVAL